MAQYALLVGLVAGLTMISSGSAHGAVQELLEAHNEARAAVGVGPLKWSGTVAEAARRAVRNQRDNMGCKMFADLKRVKGRYGANQSWSSGVLRTPRMVVDLWVEEKEYYNHTNNSCLPNHNNCGLYTQVVWRKSLELGCAEVTCSKDQTSLTLCFYNPPGNVVGESPY